MGPEHELGCLLCVPHQAHVGATAAVETIKLYVDDRSCVMGFNQENITSKLLLLLANLDSKQITSKYRIIRTYSFLMRVKQRGSPASRKHIRYLELGIQYIHLPPQILIQRTVDSMYNTALRGRLYASRCVRPRKQIEQSVYLVADRAKGANDFCCNALWVTFK